MSKDLGDFTPGQEALIERITWKIGEKLIEQIKADRERDIHDHASNCRTAKRVDRFFWLTVGAGIGGALGGGGLGGAIVYAIMSAAKYST